MNIKDFIQYISLEKQYSGHTVSAYENDLNSFSAFASSQYDIKEASDVNRDMVRSWIMELVEEGKSNTTINRKLTTLKSYFNYCIKTGTVTVNPVKNVASLKTPSRLPHFLTVQNMDRYYESMGDIDDFYSLRDFLVIDLFYSTGIRLSELINLKTDDVNLNEDTIKVLGKRNKERIIPFSEKERLYIIRYKDMKKEIFGAENPYLIVTNRGNKAYPKFIYRLVERNLSGITLSKRSPHVLRHTFATHMLNEGADLNTIKEILGHSNLSATQVYTHNTIEQLKSIYNHAHPRAQIKKEV